MSGRQTRTEYDGSSTPDADVDLSGEETSGLRAEVLKEIRTEEENLSLIARHDQRARMLLPLLLGILIVNIVLALTLPRYDIYWIVVGFFVYMYYFIVLLLPTTRRIRTPAEKKAGVKRRRKGDSWSRGAKVAVMRGKKAVVIAFWNSFFVGTQTLARGVSAILLMSIGLALLALLIGSLDLLSVMIIIAQSLGIMGFYYVIIRLRPYSKDFLRTIGQVKVDERTWRRGRAYLKGLMVVLVLMTIFAVFIVTAIFLPRRSVEAVLTNIGPDIGPVVIGVILIFITQFVIVRYIQGFDSAKITTQFIKNKLRFLDHEVLPVLDEIETSGVGTDGASRFQVVQHRFRASRIYKVVYKDIFGILPTYPIIVDFRSVLEKDVADSLGAEIPIDIPS